MAKFIKVGDKIVDVERIKIVQPITDDMRRSYAFDEGATHSASTDTVPLWLTQSEFDDFARQVLGEKPPDDDMEMSMDEMIANDMRRRGTL